MYSNIPEHKLTQAAEVANRLYIEVTLNNRTPEDLLAWAEQLEKYLVLPLRQKARDLAK
jgi:hypothetical protein